MNEIWHKITKGDPYTLPPKNQLVFAVGGNLSEPMILVRSDANDENGDLCWAWCKPHRVCWAEGRWQAIDPEWDDDYQPEYWHAFPTEQPSRQGSRETAVKE